MTSVAEHGSGVQDFLHGPRKLLIDGNSVDAALADRSVPKTIDRVATSEIERMLWATHVRAWPLSTRY